VDGKVHMVTRASHMTRHAQVVACKHNAFVSITQNMKKIVCPATRSAGVPFFTAVQCCCRAALTSDV
jgi:hypothetical protein